MNLPLGREPIIIIGLVISVLQIIQAAVIPGISPGVHAVIGVVIVVLGALVGRAAVTPVAQAEMPFASAAVKR